MRSTDETTSDGTNDGTRDKTQILARSDLLAV